MLQYLIEKISLKETIHWLQELNEEVSFVNNHNGGIDIAGYFVAEIYLLQSHHSVNSCVY